MDYSQTTTSTITTAMATPAEPIIKSTTTSSSPSHTKGTKLSRKRPATEPPEEEGAAALPTAPPEMVPRATDSPRQASSVVVPGEAGVASPSASQQIPQPQVAPPVVQLLALQTQQRLAPTVPLQLQQQQQMQSLASQQITAAEESKKEKENTKEQWVSMSRLERKRFQEKRRRLEFKEALDKLLETLLRHDEGFLKEAQIREARFSGRVINRPPNTDENSLFNRVEMVNQAIFTIERSARENEEMKQSIAALRDGREPDSAVAANVSRLHNTGFHQGVGPLIAPIPALDAAGQLQQHMNNLHHLHGGGTPGGSTDPASARALLAAGQATGGGRNKQPAYARSITANAGASTAASSSISGTGAAVAGAPEADHLGATSRNNAAAGLSALTAASRQGGAPGGNPGPQDLMWLRQLELEGRRQQLLSQQSIAQLQLLNNASVRLRSSMPGQPGGVNNHGMGAGGIGGAGMGAGAAGLGAGGIGSLLPFLQLGAGQHPGAAQLSAHLSALEQQQLGLAAQQQQQRGGGGRGGMPDEIPSELLSGGASSEIYVPVSGGDSQPGSRKHQRLHEGAE